MGVAAGQTAQPKAPRERPAPTPASKADAAKKAAILSSEPWRKAMFRINEWLGAQQVYNAQEVARIKADFSARVARMPADEVQFVLDDLNTKFQILDTKDAEDARAWLAHYLSILSDKKRAEVLNRIPNIVTMSAPQLQQLIGQIDEKRAAMDRQQSQVAQLRNSAPNPWNQPYNAAQQAYVRDRETGRSAYSSPYRASSNELPFANARVGPSMSIYSGGLGGFGVVFGN